MFSNFGFENRAVYEVMWKRFVQLDRPQMTILRMRIACWVPRAANTHWEYAILIAFPRQHWLRERASKLRLYVHCLCVISFVMSQKPLLGQVLLIIELSRSHCIRHTTLIVTPLYEWSARRSDLSLTTHNTHERQTSVPRRDSNPQSNKQAAADSRLWQRGHWDHHFLVILTFTFSWTE